MTKSGVIRDRNAPTRPYTVMRHLPCFRLLAQGSFQTKRPGERDPASRRSRTSKCSSALRFAALPHSFLSRRWFVATKLISTAELPGRFSYYAARCHPGSERKSDSGSDAQVQSKVAVLDLMPPFIKSHLASIMAEPFGLTIEHVTSGQILTKWRDVQVEIRAENDIRALCRSSAQRCPAAARAFRISLRKAERGSAVPAVG